MIRTNYRFSLILAIALHVLLFIALFIHFINTPTQPPASAAGPAAQVIQAVAVVQNQLSTPPQPKPQPAPEPKPAPQPKPQVAQQQPQPADKLLQQEQAVLRIRKQQDQQAAERKRLVAEQVQQELAAQQKQTQIKQQAENKQKQLQVAKETARKLLEQEIAAAASDATQQGAGQTKINQNVIDKYKTLIIQAISQQWLVPPNIGNVQAGKLLVRLAPGGMVLTVQITRTSGDPSLDRSARVAVLKASPLPVPTDPALFNKFREISLTVQPQGISANG